LSRPPGFPFEGSEGLLDEVAAAFLEVCPALLGAVEEAVDARDPARIHRAAHSLKGSVANFDVADAVTHAARLERMGAERDLTEVAAALTALRTSVHRLQDGLTRYRNG
jgi:two-component system, sensor histidine kinase and response regulator